MIEIDRRNGTAGNCQAGAAGNCQDGAVPEGALKIHAAHKDHPGQRVRESTRLQAALGHPQAAAWRRAQDFFDALPWCASDWERFYAFRDPRNHAAFGRPELYCARSESGVPVASTEEEIRAKAAAGWSGDCFLTPGEWIVVTDDLALVAELKALDPNCDLDENMFVFDMVGQETLDQARAIIDRHFAGCLLTREAVVQRAAAAAGKQARRAEALAQMVKTLARMPAPDAWL